MKVCSSEQYLHIGGAARMELERWSLPKVSFQYTMISILLRFIEECMSMRRYSGLGLYMTIGRYWLFPSTAKAKSDVALNMFELLPTLENAFSFEPMLLGSDV